MSAISNLDVWRAANLLIRGHGIYAGLVATQRAAVSGKDRTSG